MPRTVGIDFGTTNTSVAVLADDGRPLLATFSSPDGPTETFRSILYFTPVSGGQPLIHAGPEAILACLETGQEGRLIQSLKSYLSSRDFSSTNVYGKTFQLEELLGVLLRRVRDGAERSLGPLGRRATVGRPVRFVDSRDLDADALATARLERAFAAAGFDQVTFVLEPVAAAHEYRRRLARPELALIADFGGGTTDLTLVRLEPPGLPRAGSPPGAGVDVLATAGLGIAGDVFDGRIVDEVVSPALGKNAVHRSAFGQELPSPAWLYTHLRRWHHISFLKTPRTLAMVRDMLRSAPRGAGLAALLHLIEQDLGFALHREVQATKFSLSAAEQAPFRFAEGPITVAAEVLRCDFERWIAPDLAPIAAALDRLLESADGVRAADIDAVFLTGGSAFVPAVRALFVERFGAERIRGGNELTTVASGLAMAGA